MGVVGEWLYFRYDANSRCWKPDDFKKDIYNMTLEAQLTALDLIKPGVTASEVDAAARNVIEKKLVMVNTSTTASDMVSEWMCMNSLQSWKEMTW